MLPRVGLVGLLCVFGAAPAWCQLRQEISLNGEWEMVRVSDLSSPIPQGGWQPFTVPGTITGINYECAWFRRRFTIPETMRGLRVVLHFGGVKYNSIVRVNGTDVGGHFGGYEPFDVDITAVARVGEENLLELGCHDWTGVFVDRETDFSILEREPVWAREIPRDKILAPIGGLYEQFGPWDDVELTAHPALYVKDLFIRPSVRRGVLRVDYTLENLTPEDAIVTIRPRVEDRGQTALSLPEETVMVPANQQATTTIETPWPSPRMWSFEDPYLYYLETVLVEDGRIVDQLLTRFGFREFWVEGRFFYLNGSRVNLLATSWWPEIAVSKEHIQQRIRAIKAANCCIFRTHTQPWPEIWYETADEMGLMMIPEGAVWNDDEAYRIDDPRFWDNYAAHLKAMVDRDKNKPSVVMYSLENEFYGSRLNERSPAMQDLIRMGQLVKQWDPTRPIMYESDGDPGGVADVIGLHYPHEYPDYTQWPNTAYWMDTPKDLYAFVPNRTAWVWDRTKPIYIGEFLWVPSSDPSWDTVFFGDEAYTDYETYHLKAKAESWRMAIQAYRYYEVGGISPWSMIDGPLDETNPLYASQKYAMQPIAAYLREYDHNFYSGVRVTRTADVYNDVLSPSDLVLRWALRDGEKQLDAGEQRLLMQPGERREVSFELTFPQVTERRDLTLVLTLSRGGEAVFSDRKRYSVFPPLALSAPGGMAVGLYDPVGKTREILAAAGLETKPVAGLETIPEDVKVLILGDGALEEVKSGIPVIGAPGGEQRGILNWVRGGGRALILEQKSYPAGVIPVMLSSHGSTMTFAQMPEHPLLRDVRPEDLKWWRPDHIVTSAEPARPTQGAFQSVVVSGSAEGIAHAPLLELPYGRGVLVLCQLKVTERLTQEPAAGLILRNALEYLADYQSRIARTALFCPNPKTRQVLESVGFAAHADITQRSASVDWSQFDLLVACGPLGQLEGDGAALAEWVAQGGKALLHGLTPEDASMLVELTGVKLNLVPYQGPAPRVPNAHPLSQFFANEDLYWLGEARAAHFWATKPLAPDITDCVVVKSLEGRPVTRYPSEVMHVEGTYAANTPEGASLPTGGSTATVEIEVPTSGSYILGVVAGGSQAQGIWPAGAVYVDGRLFGTFSCQRGEPDTYTVFGDLEQGRHEVAIRFTNDAYNPPSEDRNLLVQALLVAPDEDSRDVTLLTSPGAVVAVRRGKGLVVVDNINWDKTEQNAVKASRYLSGLLTGLGAPFSTRDAVVLEAEIFERDPAMAWFHTTADGAYLGSAGYISTRVQCARGGRYTVWVRARGTPVDGIYPIIAVEVDNQPIGDIELTSPNWRWYRINGEFREGIREIKLIFANDEFRPPQDRNLEVDKVEVIATD